MQKKLGIVWIYIFCSLGLLAQKVSNIKAVALSPDSIQITYDLAGLNSSDEVYNIEILASNNGFSTPLTKVLGDIGSHILPGKSKTVTWLAANEISGFEGNVSFKIKATLVAAPWRILIPKTNGFIRRGKESTISWTGMAKGAEQVRIELWDKNKTAQKWDQLPNTGQQQLKVDPKLKTGVYELRVSNTMGKEFASTAVQVKPLVPLALKLSPILIVGGVLAAILVGDSKHGGSSSSSSSTNTSPLPAAPSHP